MATYSDFERTERRISRQDQRQVERWEREEMAAAPMIGELCRNGETIYYVCAKPGLYRESSSYTELCTYLSRNGYI